MSRIASERGRREGGRGSGRRMLLYSRDELTLLCKCQKAILSLTSFPPSNMFDDEEIKIRYILSAGAMLGDALNAY